jgi:hypothetical protein
MAQKMAVLLATGPVVSSSQNEDDLSERLPLKIYEAGTPRQLCGTCNIPNNMKYRHAHSFPLFTSILVLKNQNLLTHLLTLQ